MLMKLKILKDDDSPNVMVVNGKTVKTNLRMMISKKYIKATSSKLKSDQNK